MTRRLVLRPGMGATGAMFGEPWRQLPGAEFPDWPRWRQECDLGALAERMADELALGPDDAVGGASLGGMVALEIAARRGAAFVVLVGSARRGDEVRRPLRALAPLAPFAPIGLATALARRLPGRLGRTLAGAEPAFVRAMCRAAADWTGPEERGVALAVPVLRVHGARDAVIRPPGQGAVVPRAGHLLAMTHAAEAVAALRRQAAIGGITGL